MGKQEKRGLRPVDSPVTAGSKRTQDLAYNSPSRLAKSQGIYQTNVNTSALGLTKNPFEEDFFNPKFMGISLGDVDDSAFQSTSLRDPFNSNIDFEKIRADKQSTISKLGSTGVSFIGKTAVGVVGNIIGGFYGIGSAIANGDKAKLFDNDFNRGLDEMTEAIDAGNTVFLNRKEGLGLNMALFKDVTDAFSFITSAVVAELGMQSIGNLVGGAGILTAPTRWAKYFSQAAKIGKMMDNAQDLEKLAMRLGTTVDKLSKHKRNVDLIQAGGSMGRKMLTSTSYEAALEARGVKDEMLANMQGTLENELKTRNDMTPEQKEAYRQNFMEKATAAADKAGMATFGLNTMLLGVSNMMQFPAIFGPKFIKAKKLHTLERAGLGEVGKSQASRAAKIVGGTATILKNPATEFMEETLQGVFGKSSRNYYEDVLSTQVQGNTITPETASVASSLWKGLEDTYGTSEGIHEGIIGAIVGAIGLPGFKKVAGKSKLNWQGGIPGAIKDIRDKQKFTSTAIDAVNSAKISDAMSYKKDNLIIGKIDAQKQEKALEDGNKVEFESSQDNKVFRYVNERLKKGLNDEVAEDVSELQQMDLKLYKSTFQKEDSFTQEDKDNEVKDFSDKVDIYTKSFNKVHKSLDIIGNNTYDTLTYNRLSDILVHSVATEKVYGDRLESLKQEVYNRLKDSNVSEEEFDSFTKTAAKVTNAKELLNNYINVKGRQKEQSVKDKATEGLDSAYKYLFELEASTLESQKKMLEEQEDLGTEMQHQLDQVNIALKAKEEVANTPKFQAKKSSKVRNQQKSLEDLTAEINKGLKESASESMATLGELPKEVTTQELEEYLKLKENLQNKLNKEFNSRGILDQNDDVEGAELLDEIAEITKRLTTATEVAGSLYGVRNNPQAMFAKIQLSGLQASLAVVREKILMAHIHSMDGVDPEILKPLVEELEALKEEIEKQFIEYKELLSDKGIKQVEDAMHALDVTVKMLKDKLGIKKSKDKMDQDSGAASRAGIDTSEMTEEEAQAALEAAGVLDNDTNEDPEDDLNGEGVRLDRTNNRLNINEHTDAGPLQSAEGSPTLEESLAEGTIQQGAATTLSVVETELDAEENAYLASKLAINDFTVEQYMDGMREVQENPVDAFNDPSENVKIFIDFAPLMLDVYDKQVEDKNFTLEETDEPVYRQWLFVPRYEEDGTTKDQSNVTMRTQALKQWAQREDGQQAPPLKLKIQRVYQGQFEKHNTEGKIGKVENYERDVEELGYDADTIEMDQIMFTDQEGRYVRLDGTKTSALENHPQGVQNSSTTGEVFFGYKNKAGVTVPIKMNLAKLNIDDVGLILDVLEDYLINFNETNYQVPQEFLDKNAILKDQGPLDMHAFMSFFLKRKMSSDKGEALFLKNTYNIITKNNEHDDIAFTIFDDGFEKQRMMFPKGDGTEETTKQIKQLLSEKREKLIENLLGQRHNFNKDFFMSADEDSLNREALAEAFKSGLISHSFSVDENFDKIYESGYNKRITLTRADRDDTPGAIGKKETYVQALKNFRGTYVTKAGREDTNIDQLYFNIMDGIKKSLRVKLAQESGLTKKEKRKLLQESVESIIQKRIEQINEIGAKFPGKINPKTDHANTPEYTAEDSALDKALKHLYYFKDVALKDKNWQNEKLKETDSWGALRTFLGKFEKPPSGTTFTLMKMKTKKGKKTRVTNTIRSATQLNSMTRMINMLKHLTDVDAIKHVDINYSETYPAANGKKFKWLFQDSKALKYRELENKHHKTRLKSVDIVEQPRWENGKMVAGEVYFNLGTRSKSGKVGNQKILVLSKDMKLAKATNIMTSISLPFLGASTFEISPQFDELAQTIEDGLAFVSNSKKIALDQFSNLDIEEEDAGDWNGDELTDEELLKKQLADQGLTEDEKNDLAEDEELEDEEEDNADDLADEIVPLTKDQLGDSKLEFLFETRMANALEYAEEQGEQPTEAKVSKLKTLLEKAGVTNLTNYMTAIRHFDMESDIAIKTGEVIFNEKIEDCE